MTEGMVFYLAFLFFALIYPMQNPDMELQSQMDEYTCIVIEDFFDIFGIPVYVPPN